MPTAPCQSAGLGWSVGRLIEGSSPLRRSFQYAKCSSPSACRHFKLLLHSIGVCSAHRAQIAALNLSRVNFLIVQQDCSDQRSVTMWCSAR